jgi:hypothetical protein
VVEWPAARGLVVLIGSLAFGGECRGVVELDRR